MTNISQQKFAILYPVGKDKTYAYRVCYSESPTLVRITTITADTAKAAGVRVLRTKEPDTWEKIRAALLKNENVVFMS